MLLVTCGGENAVKQALEFGRKITEEISQFHFKTKKLS